MADYLNGPVRSEMVHELRARDQQLTIEDRHDPIMGIGCHSAIPMDID